jgi:enterochelin esterase family protein
MTHPLLQRALIEGTPLIDGERVTFVWHGSAPAPLLMGDFNGWGHMSAPNVLTQVDAELWSYTHTFEPDAYLEYAYMVDAKDDLRLPDPLNKRSIWNGVKAFNHYFHMPAAPIEPAFSRRKPRTPRGRLTHHRFGNEQSRGLMASTTRDLWLYQPPVDEAVPLLVVFDGRDYVRRTPLVAMVDNMIAQQRIRPIALALIDNGKQARLLEYAASEITIRLIVDALLPFASEHLRLVSAEDQPGVHGVLGASMGGLMALYTGLRLPQIFGRVASQSGAFAFDAALPFVVFDLVQHMPQRPLKLWLDCGKYEGLLLANRAMEPILRERGYDVRYVEYHGGHNYTSWSHMLPRALETLF